MSPRPITPGERTLLMSVFGPFTLPYADLTVDSYDADYSYTPGTIANMSHDIYVGDFSVAMYEPTRAVFLHEMTHVWQYYHGYHKIFQAILLELRHPFHYDRAYPYNLSDSSKFSSYNMEQQASIVEDWWRVTNNVSPGANTGTATSLSDYQPFIDQIRASGPPDNPEGSHPVPNSHWKPY
jgi:hypothetical protein